MKRFLVLFLMVFALLFPISVRANSNVDYTIDLYKGDLRIHEDNSAHFSQEVSFSYDSSYNGQYVTLGKAGNTPENFGIAADPTVYVEKNGQKVENPEIILQDLGDGYRLKIYNGGSSGDKVTIKVVWRLKNMLFAHQDVAELNWKPISDWDETINHVLFTLSTDEKTEESQLWGHQGYFKDNPIVENQNQGSYKVDVNRVSGVLELHGYWDAQVLGSSVKRISEDALPRILKTEETIKKNSNLLNLLFVQVIPIATPFLALSQIWRYRRFKEELNRYQSKLGKTRLYEVPEDLSPLVLAADVYQVDFKDLVDNPKGHRITFDKAVQAIILDLLDRSVLTLDKSQEVPQLSITNMAKAGSSDLAFLEMAFGQEMSLPLDQLFSDFQYDENTISNLRTIYTGSRLEDEVHKSSKDVRTRISLALAKMKQSVKQDIADLGLIPIYRPLSTKESGKLVSTYGFIFLLAILSGGLAFFFMVKGSIFVIMYIALTVFLVLFGVIMIKGAASNLTLGVVTPDGAYRLEQWTSFERMIRDIKTFKVVELEGLVVWNRLLVYATLYGEADKVRKYLKVNHIQLPEEFDYVHTPYLLHSTSHFMTTSSHSYEASTFSVSSGSSGGGGGFSGGGGGGGGGSF